jgi:hypothetical protein
MAILHSGGRGVVTTCFKHGFQNGSMNASPEINIEAFLRNIPNRITEARRQSFCDNINVVGFIQRRLEDNLFDICCKYTSPTYNRTLHNIVR